MAKPDTVAMARTATATQRIRRFLRGRAAPGSRITSPSDVGASFVTPPPLLHRQTQSYMLRHVAATRPDGAGYDDRADRPPPPTSRAFPPLRCRGRGARASGVPGGR